MTGEDTACVVCSGELFDTTAADCRMMFSRESVSEDSLLESTLDSLLGRVSDNSLLESTVICRSDSLLGRTAGIVGSDSLSFGSTLFSGAQHSRLSEPERARFADFTPLFSWKQSSDETLASVGLCNNFGSVMRIAEARVRSFSVDRRLFMSPKCALAVWRFRLLRGRSPLDRALSDLSALMVVLSDVGVA